MLSNTTPSRSATLHTPGPERFIFRYLRFKCLNPVQTLDFYQNLGMSVDWKTEQTVHALPPVPEPALVRARQQQQQRGVQSRERERRHADPADMAAAAAAAAAAVEQKQNRPPPLSVFALSFHPLGKETTPHNVQLIFEHDPMHRDEETKEEDVFSGNGGGGAAAHSDSDKGLSPEQLSHGGEISGSGGGGGGTHRPGSEPERVSTAASGITQTTFAPLAHTYEYIVLYVHFVTRLAKRLAAKGFRILMPPMDIVEIKMCILVDPNGIEVRLMELSDSQLNVSSSSKKMWYARLGYYVVPTFHADASVQWYETVFANNPSAFSARAAGGSTQKPQAGGGAGGGTDGAGGGGGSRTALAERHQTGARAKKVGTAATLRQAISQGQGFRLVDTEDFSVGLSRSVYYWLGNDLRSVSGTLCFAEQADFGRGAASSGAVYDRKKSRLLGIGFEVPSLLSAINQLRYEVREDLQWGQEQFLVEGVGLVARVRDKLNAVWVELLAAKAMESGESLAGLSGQWGSQMNAGSLPGLASLDEYAIDYNHLAGHARTLSAGAVYRVKRPEDMNIYLEPAPDTDDNARQGIERSGSVSSEEAQDESISSSMSSLHMMGDSSDDIVTKPRPPRELMPSAGLAGALRPNTRAAREAQAAREERYAFINRRKAASATW